MSHPTQLVQTPAVALYTGLSSAAVSMVVSPYPVDLDGVALTMADFGTVAYCTVDPKVSGFEEIISFTGITNNGNNTGTLTGLTRDLQSKYPYTGSGTGKTHGSSATVVFSDNPQVYAQFAAKANDETITGSWTFSTFPVTPATPLATATAPGMTRLSVAPANALIPIAVGVNDTTTFAPISAAIPSGAQMAFSGLTVPSGWLFSDGTAYSRTTYATLWAALNKNQTFTITIASPGVITSNSHGLSAGMRVRLYTTGNLPTGLSVNTDYFVIATGLTTNAFELALTPSGTAINTTGTQTGTHTFFYAPHGHGDGSTTFNVPDRRGRTIIGAGTGLKTITILSVSSNVITGNQSVANANEMQTGEAVVFTATTAGNLSNGTTYYVIRTGNNTFSLATSLANAQNAVVITLAGTEAGSFALTLSVRTLGDTGGEESHAMSSTELLSHNHPIPAYSSNSGGSLVSAGNTNTLTNLGLVTGAVGGNAAANIISPFGVDQWITKT